MYNLNFKNIKNTAEYSYIFVLGGLTIGGAEKVAHFVIQNLINEDEDVLVITRRKESEDFYKIRGDHRRIVLGGEGESGNKIAGLIKNLNYIRKLRKILRKHGNSTVISFLSRPNIYTAIASFNCCSKLVLCERNDTTRQTFGWPWDYLRTKLYKYADLVTANSRVAISGMRSFVPEEKLKYIPNPVKLPPESECANPSTSNLLLNVGRMVEAKNQQWLVQIFKALKESFNEWSLIILGDGEKRDDIEKTVNRFQIQDSVILPGFVKNPSEYYQKSGIFILSSHFEGTPNAMLEAMSHCLPCLVSDALPGAVELIENGKTGVVYKHDNKEDFISKIEYLMLNPGIRKKIGKNAYTIVKKFSEEKVFSLWKDVLK